MIPSQCVVGGSSPVLSDICDADMESVQSLPAGRLCWCRAALPGRGGGGWEGAEEEKVGRGMVEHVELGPRPNLILRSNSSEKASISSGLSEENNISLRKEIINLILEK